jgi:hypothetical protein
VGRLDENARPIAGVGLATTSAPVIEIQQYLQRLLNDAVRFTALYIDNKPHAAGFMLKSRMIQALWFRRTGLLPPKGLRSHLAFVCHFRLFTHARLHQTKI